MKKPLMLPAITSVDYNDEEEIIFLFAEKFVHISDNGSEDESNNDLLLTNK